MNFTMTVNVYVKNLVWFKIYRFSPTVLFFFEMLLCTHECIHDQALIFLLIQVLGEPGTQGLSLKNCFVQMHTIYNFYLPCHSFIHLLAPTG